MKENEYFRIRQAWFYSETYSVNILFHEGTHHQLISVNINCKTTIILRKM